MASDAIHSVIGSEPILDQFDTESRDEFIGSYTDDFITGSLAVAKINAAGYLNIVTGSRGGRGRVFSRFYARNQPVPDTSQAELENNTSLSFRFQPWYERVGNTRFIVHTDNAERFWDSMMPNIDTCFKADGSAIWKLNITDGVTRNALQYITSTSVGFIYFDYNFSVLTDEQRELQNSNWTWAYPFEPRYLKAARQNNVAKSFVARTSWDGTNPPESITPEHLTGFYFGPINVAINSIMLVSDVNLAGPITSSANVTDMSKALFGFGDQSNVGYVVTEQFGTNHFAEFVTGSAPISSLRFHQGVIIRGWKYGVYSGLPAFNKAYFRRDRYGQFRDMMEQRLDTKFFVKRSPGAVTRGSVTVTFVDQDGKRTKPENTTSQNLSLEVTSSFPYLDGIARNRLPINTNTLNLNLLTLTSDVNGNVAL